MAQHLDMGHKMFCQKVRKPKTLFNLYFGNSIEQTVANFARKFGAKVSTETNSQQLKIFVVKRERARALVCKFARRSNVRWRHREREMWQLA